MAESHNQVNIESNSHFRKQNKLIRPEPKRSSRDNSKQKTSRDNSKESKENQVVHGLTLDEYLSHNQKYEENEQPLTTTTTLTKQHLHCLYQKDFQKSKSIELSQNEINYLIDDFYINEVDEDLYSESHVDSFRPSRLQSHKIANGSTKIGKPYKTMNKKIKELTINLSEERSSPITNLHNIPALNEILINDSNNLDLDKQQELSRKQPPPYNNNSRQLNKQEQRRMSHQQQQQQEDIFQEQMFRTMYNQKKVRRGKKETKDDQMFYQTLTENSKQQQQMWQTSTFVFQNQKSPSYGNTYKVNFNPLPLPQAIDTRNSFDRQKSLLLKNNKLHQESNKVIHKNQKNYIKKYANQFNFNLQEKNMFVNQNNQIQL